MADSERLEALKLMNELVSGLLENPNDDWITLNQVCDLALSHRTLAEEAIRVIRRLLASPPSQALTQLRTIRLWAILFHTRPETMVISSVADRDFVATIDETLKHEETSYRVREKLLLVLGSYVYQFAGADNENPLTRLWRTHKQPGQPYQGLYIAPTSPYLNPLENNNNNNSGPPSSSAAQDNHLSVTVPLIRATSLPENFERPRDRSPLSSHHPSLTRPPRSRSASRERSARRSRSPSPLPAAPRSPRWRPNDPNALIAGPAYPSSSSRNPALLSPEELESPTLRKRLSHGMLGALFKGSKSKDESEEPPERAFVVVRGFQAEEIRDTSDAGSIPVQREGRLVHVDIPLFPPEHYAGPASPRFHSSLQSTLSPSESHPPHPSTHSQDIFSYIRNSPDPHLTLNMPIADLCKHIRVASMTPTPPNSPTTPQSPSPADNLITWASWFKETVGLRHEFLTLKVKGFNGERDFWMRFDRSAAGVRKSWGLGLMGNSHFNIKSVSSIYQANDMVMLSGEEEALLSGDPHTLQAKVRFRKPPTLMDLQVLLTVIGEESAEYDLFRENCYFFCSVVHQILYELHEGHMTVGEFHHQTLGGDARKRIVNRLRQQSMPWTSPAH